MKRDAFIMWAAIVFLFGGLLMVASAISWNRHRDNTALGAHVPALGLLAVGGVLAVCALLFIVWALFQPKEG